MTIMESLLQAYIKPEMDAQKALQFKQGAPQREAEATSSAWGKLLEDIKPKADVAGALYDKPSGNNVLDALTQSAPAKQAHQELAPQQSPMQRFQAQISSMIGSGDPALQKRGLALLSKPTASSDMNTNDYKNYLLMTPPNKRGEYSFKQYMADNRTRMFDEQRVGHGDRFQDKDGNRVDVKAGTTMTEVKKMNLYPYKAASADSAGKTAMLKTAQKEFDVIENNLYTTTDGKREINQKLVKELWAIQNLPMSAAVLSTEAGKVNAAFETGMQAITRTETGAAMAKEEIDNTKIRFMPKPWDDAEVQQQKMNAFKYFIDNAVEMLDPSREGNTGLTPQQITNRAVNQAMNKSGHMGSRQEPMQDENGVSYWHENGVLHAINPETGEEMVGGTL